MRDYLDGFSQIVTATFLVDHALVNTAGCDIVGLCSLNAQETFVVSQVKIGFMAVYGHIAFSVLVRIQSSGVNVDVRIKFLDCYAVASCLQQLTYR